MDTVKCVPIPDRRSLDKYGNPQRWILKVVEPPHLRGLVVFPQFDVKPDKEYIVDIIKRGQNYAVGKIHEHVWEIYKIDEDPYIVKTIMRCRCGAWHVEHKQKFYPPLVEGWRNRWYVQHAVELQRRSHEVVKNAPPRKYLYVAVRDRDSAEKLFETMRHKTLEEICERHETVIYDDEAGKYRVVAAWRGASDKSWICTDSPTSGYVPVWGWIDNNSFTAYTRAKTEAETLWKMAEDVLGQRIDVGQRLPNGHRYASSLASFL